jgi:DNA topoisomerase-1
MSHGAIIDDNVQNYIDPRLTVVFAKKFDVPLEKLFPKTLREKFRWAIASVADQDDWEF